jgi:predicted nuclease of predicted toxin-antitoxin system
MRFLVDECTGPAVARWLREQQYDVFSVYEEARGLDDDEIVQQAFADDRILITNDKDFGEKVYVSAPNRWDAHLKEIGSWEYH